MPEIYLANKFQVMLMRVVQEPSFESHCFFWGGGRWVVRNRKEVKVIDIEKVRIMRGLGHQSSIKAQCAHGVLGEHVL